MCAHDLSYSTSDQRTGHHVDTDVRYNEYSHSLKTPEENNYSSYQIYSKSLHLKKYLCFQTEGKTVLETQCAKSWALTKAMDTICEIDSFENKCVIIKGLLRSEQQKKNMATIGLYQSLSNSSLYEHRCLGNINNS